MHTESRQFNLNQGEITSNQHEYVNELFPLTGDLLVDTLREVYKLENFRPFQKEMIQLVMNRKHIHAVMPTGSGKTLCFTMPATLSTGCVTFAIFPLNSLMIDMFNHISQIAISCTMINHHTSKESIEILLNDLNSTNPHTKIVLITPESLQKADFKQAIKILANRKLLAFIAIDEMHAIADSSHEYRDD